MFEQTFKNIDDVLWKEAGCTTELDYTEQTSWMLFLKYLDDLEHEKAMAADLVGNPSRADRPALKAVGWGVVEASRVRREVITLGRLQGGKRAGLP